MARGATSIHVTTNSPRVHPNAGSFEPGPLAALRLLRGGHCSQLVTAIVVGVIGMTLGPGPSSLVTVDLSVQILPEVLIDHGLFGGCHPTFSFPAVDPVGNAVFQIL